MTIANISFSSFDYPQSVADNSQLKKASFKQSVGMVDLLHFGAALKPSPTIFSLFRFIPDYSYHSYTLYFLLSPTTSIQKDS